MPGRLDIFVEALPDPVLVIGRGQRIVAANIAARHLFPALLEHISLPMVIRSPDLLDATARVFAGGAATTTMLHERVPVERVFEVHAAPLRDDGVDFAVLTLRDLTAARRVEKMRVDFIANASHELRTPLASLLGFIETLQGAAKDDAAARERFLTIMRDQGQRMARLIDDLLSLSQIEQQQHLRPQSPVDLVEIVRHCADALTPVAQENAVTISIEAPDRLVVAGNRDELTRVAENLIENAIKYGASDSGAPSSVEVVISLVKLGETRTGARLSVRDHGAGIAAEHLPRLTERFYRVDAGKSRAKGGTGLGLALVKHIVARHRGQLRVASRPGDGAEFTVDLPLDT
ncbi:MAG: two-component sensor histidine kinase [Hyphomicrobiales bacterium]|nr:two-component sensor histidine kinase [Hyphomicrobiales bacterium]